MDTDAEVVLVTAESPIRDTVEAAAAALGLALVVEVTVPGALARWARAGTVLVGGDQAAALASVGPPRRDRVHLIGFDPAELGAWSVPLGAEVVPLPHGATWLPGILAARADPECRTIAVVGGSGGVGATTVAAGLALTAAGRGRSVALVDLDAWGGGIDLLLGAERVPGWRWPRLLGAAGEVGDVRGVLPVVDGVTVLAMGRGEPSTTPTPAAVQAVLGSLVRHHEVVLVDAGRGPHPVADQTVRGADAAVLVCGEDVRAVAAASAVAAGWERGPAGVVVQRRVLGPPGVVVSDVLGLPAWGEVPWDRHLRSRAERGQAPIRTRSRWAQAVGRCWDRIGVEVGRD